MGGWERAGWGGEGRDGIARSRLPLPLPLPMYVCAQRAGAASNVRDATRSRLFPGARARQQPLGSRRAAIRGARLSAAARGGGLYPTCARPAAGRGGEGRAVSRGRASYVSQAAGRGRDWTASMQSASRSCLVSCWRGGEGGWEALTCVRARCVWERRVRIERERAPRLALPCVLAYVSGSRPDSAVRRGERESAVGASLRFSSAGCRCVHGRRRGGGSVRDDIDCAGCRQQRIRAITPPKQRRRRESRDARRDVARLPRIRRRGGGAPLRACVLRTSDTGPNDFFLFSFFEFGSAVG